MRSLVVLAALVACDRGKASEPARGPAASGSMVFDTRPATEADVFLATESEIVKSGPLVNRVNEEYRTTELTADAITVVRRPGTMILDVMVRNADPARARDLCNQLLKSYAEHRMTLAVMGMNKQLEVMVARLEQTPDDADLKRNVNDLELQARMRKNDVRLLEPCTPRR
jgi:hypothetical protein